MPAADSVFRYSYFTSISGLVCSLPYYIHMYVIFQAIDDVMVYRMFSFDLDYVLCNGIVRLLLFVVNNQNYERCAPRLCFESHI